MPCWLSHFLDSMVRFKKETAGGGDAFSPVMWGHRRNTTQAGEDFCLTQGKAGNLAPSFSPPGKQSKWFWQQQCPQLSHPIQLSEWGWELSFSGAAWGKVGLRGWPAKLLCDCLWFALDSKGLVWDTSKGLPSTKEYIYGHCLRLEIP